MIVDDHNDTSVDFQSFFSSDLDRSPPPIQYEPDYLCGNPDSCFLNQPSTSAAAAAIDIFTADGYGSGGLKLPTIPIFGQGLLTLTQISQLIGKKNFYFSFKLYSIF